MKTLYQLKECEYDLHIDDIELTMQINTATLHQEVYTASQWQEPTLGPQPPDFCLRPSSSISLHGAIPQTSQTDKHPALILIVHTQYWFQLNLKFLANIVNIATWTNMFIISSNIVSYFTGDFFLLGPGSGAIKVRQSHYLSQSHFM